MACLRRKDAIVSWKYFELLKGDFAQLLLLKIDTILTGDHTTFIYEVKHTKNIQDEAASACDVGGEIKESVKNMQKKNPEINIFKCNKKRPIQKHLRGELELFYIAFF